MIFTSNYDIEFISIQRDNLAILQSNLTGNIWNGQILLGKLSENEFAANHFLNFNTGIKHGLWHSGTLYVGTDEGHLFSYNTSLELLNHCPAHHDIVNAIAKKGKNIVSSDSLE